MLTTHDLLAITVRTLFIAGAATLVASPPAIALAWLLARYNFRGKWLVQAVLTLPLILPPVAVGLLLLEMLSPQRSWGHSLHVFLGGNPLFTWRAAVMASIVMGAPLLIRTGEAAFATVPRECEIAARSLGAGGFRTFFLISLPLASRGVLYGVLLCFMRAIGEFGATTLVAGNIPGETETLSLAIYSRTITYHDREALTLCAVASCIALAATVFAELLLRRWRADATAGDDHFR